MLIIGTVRHQHQGLGVFRYIAAVLMPVIDKQLDFQFYNQLGLLVLREINHRVANPMFPEPIAGNLADVIGVPFIAMRYENQFLLAAESVQSLPLLCLRKRQQCLPEFRIIRNPGDALRDDL